MKSKRRATRTGEVFYPTLEERTAVHQAELDAYIAGKGPRPDWASYAAADDRRWFGPETLTRREDFLVKLRDGRVFEQDEDGELVPMDADTYRAEQDANAGRFPQDLTELKR